MLPPNKATYFGRSLDGRLIWYYKQSLKTKEIWFYLSDADYRRGISEFRRCINKPTLTLMKITDW